MRSVWYHRTFKKNFRKRIAPNPKLVEQFEARLVLFTHGEHGYPLYDHPLTGNHIGRRSFSITGDIRIIYEEVDDGAAVLIDIGTHAQVYG